MGSFFDICAWIKVIFPEWLFFLSGSEAMSIEGQNTHNVIQKNQENTILRTYRKVFAVMTAGGLFGAAYVFTSPVFSYGVVTFFFLQNAFLPENPTGLLSYSMTFELIAATLLIGISFLMTQQLFRKNVYKNQYRKSIRFSTVLMAVPFLETFLIAVLSLVLGYFPAGSSTASGPALTFSTSNLLETLAYIGALAFIWTFFISCFAGIVIGIFYGFVGYGTQLSRVEFVIVAVLVFIGIFYFPMLVPAGIFGIYATLPVSYRVRTYLHRKEESFKVILERLRTRRSTFVYTLIFGTALFLASFPFLFTFREQTGLITFYTYAFQGWIVVVALLTGIIGAVVMSSSLMVLAGRKRSKQMFLIIMLQTSAALAILIYLTFFYAPVASTIYLSPAILILQPVIAYYFGILIGSLSIFQAYQNETVERKQKGSKTTL